MTEETTPIPMTRRDRDDLAKAVRARCRVLKSEVDQRAAEALAEFEQKVTVTYSAYDERWRAVVAKAQAAADEVNRTLRREFDAAGLPDEFRPQAGFVFVGRGEVRVPFRQAELRRAAKAHLDAQAKRAKLQVERLQADQITTLIAGGLASGAAAEFLAALPTAAALVPGANLAELEAEVGR